MEGVALYTLFTLGLTSLSSGFMYRNNGDIGVLLPDDPYIYIGHQVELTCNLTRPLQEDSTRMYFTRKDNRVISRNYVHVLSTRSIQLRMPVTSMYDEGNYVCKLNTTHEEPKIIANQYVKVEYEPRAVDAIDCRVYNWENMTCTWNLGVSYLHMEDIDIQLVWTVEHMPHDDCPHPTPTSCTWKMGTFDSTYFDGMMYYMQLTIRNKRTEDTKKSSLMKKDTRRIVEPAAVSNVQYIHINSTCVRFTWSHSRPLDHKIFRIRYKSDWDHSHWKELRVADGSTRVLICDLAPYTEYVVKIDCKPLIDGYWSKEVDTTLWTLEDVPGAAPSLHSGSFSEEPCDMLKDCRKVILYWQPIPRTAANGKIKNYRITKTTQSTGRKEEFISQTNEESLVLAESQDYVIEIRGATNAGLSPHFSTIRIPAQIKMPPFPENFKVEAVNASSDDQKLVRVSWTAPTQVDKEVALSIVSYTVYWCKGSHSLRQCSTEPLQWKVVDPSTGEYYLNLSRINLEHSIFGISMETKMTTGEEISSGILWNSCIFDKNERPSHAPKNFAIMEYPGESRIRLDWDLFQCHESHGYIHLYVIYYCTASWEGNCTGQVKTRTVSGKDTTFTLQDLQTETTYRVWMAAEAEAGLGPVTDPLYITVVHPIKVGISMEEIIGIATAVVFVCLLALFSVIVFVKRCVTTVKQKFKPYDIIMPHVPLPPIPMPDPLPPPQSPSSDDSDSIYERIDGRKHDSSTPSSPDGSIDIPLINKNGTLTKNQLYGDQQKMYLRSHGGKTGTDSGRGSMISAAESIMARLQGQSGSGTLERRQYGYGVTQGHPCPAHLRDIPRYSYGIHNISTFSGVPRSPVWKKKRLSSSQDVLRNVETSPYSCVDIVNLPTKSRDHIVLSEHGSHSVGSTYSDPAYGTNNLSATPLSKKSVTLPSKSADNFLNHNHYNIKRHPVDIKSLQDYSDSNEMDSDQSPPSKASDSVVMTTVPKVPVSSYVKLEDSDVTADETCSLDENTLEIDKKEFPKPVKSSYVCQGQFEKNRKHKLDVTSSPKQLNIKPGIRPISEVVNVPPHFYGSLSLLDSGDATEL